MTEPEDGAGLPSLLASLNVCGLPASVLAVVEREAGRAVNLGNPAPPARRPATSRPRSMPVNVASGTETR